MARSWLGDGGGRILNDQPPVARIALKLPLFDGRGFGIFWVLIDAKEDLAAPVIEPSVPSFPFNTNVPASRPTLPSGNSTGPENVTGAFMALGPRCLRGPGGPPEFQSWIKKQERAFPGLSEPQSGMNGFRHSRR